MLAAKAALATRVDALGEDCSIDLGAEHKVKVEARIRLLEEGNLRRISGTGKAKAKFEKYHSKRWVLTPLIHKNTFSPIYFQQVWRSMMIVMHSVQQSFSVYLVHIWSGFWCLVYWCFVQWGKTVPSCCWLNTTNKKEEAWWTSGISKKSANWGSCWRK